MATGYWCCGDFTASAASLLNASTLAWNCGGSPGLYLAKAHRASAGKGVEHIVGVTGDPTPREEVPEVPHNVSGWGAGRWVGAGPRMSGMRKAPPRAAVGMRADRDIEDPRLTRAGWFGTTGRSRSGPSPFSRTGTATTRPWRPTWRAELLARRPEPGSAGRLWSRPRPSARPRPGTIHVRRRPHILGVPPGLLGRHV